MSDNDNHDDRDRHHIFIERFLEVDAISSPRCGGIRPRDRAGSRHPRSDAAGGDDSRGSDSRSPKRAARMCRPRAHACRKTGRGIELNTCMRSIIAATIRHQMSTGLGVARLDDMRYHGA